MPQMSPIHSLILMMYFIISMMILLMTINKMSNWKVNKLNTMSNLFWSFDPSTGVFSFNWLSLFL